MRGRLAPVVLLGVVALFAPVLAGCGDDNLSKEECAAEFDKLFDDAGGDPEKIAERVGELTDKGCADSDQGGSSQQGGDEDDGDPATGEVSRQCLELSAEVAAAGTRVASEKDAEKRQELAAGLQALQERYQQECPEGPNSPGG
jgi:hypothetical protein